MAQIHGPTVDERGQYCAVELMGHDLVRLVRVGVLPRCVACQAIQGAGPQGRDETLDACIARLLEQAL